MSNKEFKNTMLGKAMTNYLFWTHIFAFVMGVILGSGVIS